MTERLVITTSDGATLEARIDSPAEPTRFTVFCHPSPLHGGSMNAPLMIAVARQLVARGHSVLRFNFRGVGASTGKHGFGEGELADITAAVDMAGGSNLPMSLGGWSFGAATSLRWLADNGSRMPYAGIAPPPEGLPDALPGGPTTIVLGTRDQVIDGPALEDYARRVGIDLILTPGDHFFHGRGARIGDLVGDALEA